MSPVMATPLKVWLEQEGRLLRLRLARPKANLIDAQMIAALDDALTVHLGQPSLSAVLIDQGPSAGNVIVRRKDKVIRCVDRIGAA